MYFSYWRPWTAPLLVLLMGNINFTLTALRDKPRQRPLTCTMWGHSVNTSFYTHYLRIALGAWPPTTYITFGKPIGVLGRVLGDCTDDRCSLVSRWYFIASIRKSLHMLLFLTSISVSTRLTRYSRERRGRRTCSMSWAKQSCLCSGSWFTHVTTASNTWNKK